MAREELKARDKIVTRMTREGAVEEISRKAHPNAFQRGLKTPSLSHLMIPKPETSPKRSGSEDSSVPKSWKMLRDKPKQKHRPQRPHRNISRVSFW